MILEPLQHKQKKVNAGRFSFDSSPVLLFFLYFCIVIVCRFVASKCHIRAMTVDMYEDIRRLLMRLVVAESNLANSLLKSLDKATVDVHGMCLLRIPHFNNTYCCGAGLRSCQCIVIWGIPYTHQRGVLRLLVLLGRACESLIRGTSNRVSLRAFLYSYITPFLLTSLLGGQRENHIGRKQYGAQGM